MIEQSYIGRWLMKIIHFIGQIYSDSMFGTMMERLVGKGRRWMFASKSVGFFLTPPTKGMMLKSILTQRVSGALRRILSSVEQRLNPVLDQSIAIRLIDRIPLHMAVTVVWLISMIFIPTTLSVLLAIVVMFSYLYESIRKKHVRNISTVYVWAWLWLLMLLFSTITGFHGSESGLIGTIYITYLIGGLTIGRMVGNKQQVYVVMFSLMFITLLACLLGIYQYVIGVEVDPAWVDEEIFDTLQTRIYSVFGNPNVFGIFLVLMAPIALALTLGLKHWMLKVMSAGMFALSVLCIGLTMSRGSMIGIVLALGVMVILMNGKFIVLGVAALVTMPLYLPQSIMQRIMSIGNLQESSSAYRVSIYQASLDMARDFLAGGVGMGGFKKVYFAYAYSASKSYHAHNTFLMILLEHGIIGFVLFAVVMIFWIKEVLSAILVTTNMQYKYLLMAFLGGIVGSSAQGMVEHIWHNYDVMFFYWLLIFLGSGVAYLARKETVHA